MQIGTFEEVAQALRDADDFVIAGHVSPDGDCIGSQLGLAAALRKLGKTCTCVLAKPESLEYGLSTLPGAQDLTPACEFERDFGCFVSVDVPNLDRMGDSAALHARSPRTIAIDHHLWQEPLSQVNYMDSEAAACAMIIWKLLGYVGVEPDEEIATCLFTGLSTDTGSFCFQNATSEVFQLAAKMVAAGADCAQIAADVYQNRSVSSLELESIMISRMETLCSGAVVVSHLSLDDFTRTGAVKSDAEPLIDTLRSVRDARVACILREQDDCVRGSIRAKDETDVADIAAHFGGGGHRAAAGFTIPGTLEEARAQVEAELKRLF